MIKISLFFILVSLTSITSFADTGGDVSGGGIHRATVLNGYSGLTVDCGDHIIYNCLQCGKHFDENTGTFNQEGLDKDCNEL